MRETLIGCLQCAPHWESSPKSEIPACALTGIQTRKLLVHGKMLNQMSHTSQREISPILQRGKLRPGKKSNSLTKLSNVLLISGLV